MRKFFQKDAPVILYSKNGVKLYEFVDRYLYTDDDDLANLLLAMGAVEVENDDPPPPQDLTEVIERLNLLGGRVSSVEARSNIRSIGDGLSLSGAGELSATGGGGGDANLAADMTATKAVGGVSTGKKWDAGTALETVLRDVLSPTLNPTLTPPSASVSGNFPAMAAVGQEIPATTATVALNRGSISPAYGTDGYRSGPATGYALKMTGATVSFDESGSSASFSLPAFTRHQKGAVTLTGTASYGEGQQPKNSAGADYSTPLEAGSVSGSRTIQFVIPFYRGVSDTAEISSLAGFTQEATAKADKTYTYAPDNQHVVFAYDVDYGDLSSILDANGFENINGFVKSVVGQCNVYVMANKTTDPGAKYTFKF